MLSLLGAHYIFHISRIRFNTEHSFLMIMKPATRTPLKPSRTKSPNTKRTKNKTTNLAIQQNSRKLLMLDILMSETCWAHKKWNKIASDIKLVFYSSTITMMHGPISIKFPAIFQAKFIIMTGFTTTDFVTFFLLSIITRRIAFFVLFPLFILL